MTAFALRAREPLTADRHIVRRPTFLPEGGSPIEIDFPVAGPAGFLVAKVAALNRRNKVNEAYGLLWLMDSWASAPQGLAQTIAGGAVMSLPISVTAEREMVARLTSTEDSHE